MTLGAGFTASAYPASRRCGFLLRFGGHLANPGTGAWPVRCQLGELVDLSL